MAWLTHYWWVLVLIFLVGVLINVVKDLSAINVQQYLKNKPKLPPHRDFNAKWDDEDEEDAPPAKRTPPNDQR